MDYITIDTLRKMQAVGFSYPDYEHFLNYGMLYYFNNDEYLIGGFFEGNFSDQNKAVAEQGQWLPEATQLLSWLTNTDFKVTISMEDENFFSIQATDMIDGTEYSGSDHTLANALAKTIIKICKSARRRYIPKSKLRLQVIE